MFTNLALNLLTLTAMIPATAAGPLNDPDGWVGSAVTLLLRICGMILIGLAALTATTLTPKIGWWKALLASAGIVLIAIYVGLLPNLPEEVGGFGQTIGQTQSEFDQVPQRDPAAGG